MRRREHLRCARADRLDRRPTTSCLFIVNVVTRILGCPFAASIGCRIIPTRHAQKAVIFTEALARTVPSHTNIIIIPIISQLDESRALAAANGFVKISINPEIYITCWCPRVSVGYDLVPRRLCLPPPQNRISVSCRTTSPPGHWQTGLVESSCVSCAKRQIVIAILFCPMVVSDFLIPGPIPLIKIPSTS